ARQSVGKAGELVRTAERRVGCDRPGRGIEHRIELDGVEQYVIAAEFAQQRRDELLLQADTGQVTAIAETSSFQAIASTYERQGRVALDHLWAGGQGKTALAVIDRLGQAHRSPADGVGEVLEALKVDFDEVVDPEVAEPLDRRDRARGTAVFEGIV